MTIKDITRHRLHRQQLAAPGFTTTGDVVQWLGAVQAQDYLGALWSVGLRMKKADEAIVEQALADKTVVRSWPMRGTLHFVAPNDLRWMLKYLTPRVITRAASIYRQAELEKKDFIKSGKVFEKVLAGGRQLTRDEMYAALEKARIKTDNIRGLHILGYLAQQGLICFGIRKGKQQTFTLLDEWIPPAKMPEKDEALAILAQRYYTSHGPATVEDLMWWAGLNKTEATAAVESVRHQLLHETVNGATYWFAEATAPKIKPGTAYLLPTYDEYGIGYKDRSAIIDPAVGGTFTSSIVIDGWATGVWRRTLKKEKVVIHIKPFTSLFTAAQHKAIATAASRYGKFIGSQPIIDED